MNSSAKGGVCFWELYPDFYRSHPDIPELIIVYLEVLSKWHHIWVDNLQRSETLFCP